MLMGQQIGSYTPSTHGNHWDTTLAAARACEQAGLDSVWLADHFMFPDKENPEKEKPVFDCFVALGAIAASTSRIRIGELVVGVPYQQGYESALAGLLASGIERVVTGDIAPVDKNGVVASPHHPPTDALSFVLKPGGYHPRDD